MSNSISRRTFLKCTGASVAALGAASLLGGCQQNGSATIVDVKVVIRSATGTALAFS